MKWNPDLIKVQDFNFPTGFNYVKPHEMPESFEVKDIKTE